MIIVQLDSEQLSDLIQKSFRKVIAEIPSQSTIQKSEELLTVEEAAKLLHVSVPTIYTKISKNELPVIKNKGSKRCYFYKSELLDYLKTGRKKTVREIGDEAEKYINKKAVTSS
jgi:excisionase family DNA binding protein